MELMVNSPHILRIGKLNFSEELFGKLFYPNFYGDKKEINKEEKPEGEEANAQTPASDPWSHVPEDQRLHMYRLMEL
jgi:hypothetical protein